MNEEAIRRYVEETFAGVATSVHDGDAFFTYDPERNLPPDRFWPFATIVTKDNAYDAVSNLDRPGVFRLNFGVGKETFQRIIRGQFDGRIPSIENAAGTPYDFAQLDRLIPHPTYGKMYWMSILSPSDVTFETIKPLLREAYDRAVERHERLRQNAASDDEDQGSS